jgi:hypothetical protein
MALAKVGQAPSLICAETRLPGCRTGRAAGFRRGVPYFDACFQFAFI